MGLLYPHAQHLFASGGCRRKHVIPSRKSAWGVFFSSFFALELHKAFTRKRVSGIVMWVFTTRMIYQACELYFGVFTCVWVFFCLSFLFLVCGGFLCLQQKVRPVMKIFVQPWCFHSTLDSPKTSVFLHHELLLKIREWSVCGTHFLENIISIWWCDTHSHIVNSSQALFSSKCIVNDEYTE